MASPLDVKQPIKVSAVESPDVHMKEEDKPADEGNLM
jgi:hypothetical protein